MVYQTPDNRIIRVGLHDVNKQLADTRRLTGRGHYDRVGVFIGATEHGRCIVQVCVPVLRSETYFREFGTTPNDAGQDAICKDAHEKIIKELKEIQEEIANHIEWMQKGVNECEHRRV